jgi:homocysteine S-methyltransferase
LTHEHVVYETHAEFAAAGCHVLTTISYQLSPENCGAHAAFENETGEAALIRLCAQAVSVAKQAAARSHALVAGSVGPMGAAAHDGSEFTGAYAVTSAAARSFHEPRLRALHNSGVDILAVETQCNWTEIEWLADNLPIICPGLRAWVSFQIKSGSAVADGTPLQHAVQRVLLCPSVVGVGVNCADAATCLEAVRVCAAEVAQFSSCSGRHVDIIAYPNGGGTWNGQVKSWEGRASDSSLANNLLHFVEAGVTVFGGCCRVSAQDIAQVAADARKLQLI